MRIHPIAFIAVILTAATASAQLTPEQARAIDEKSIVSVVVPDGVWKGQLVAIDADSVTIQSPGWPQRTLPLTSVLRIDQKKRDSLADGAAGGAFVAGLWCLLVCGQGLGSGGDLGAAVMFNALIGAGLGAAIDARHTASVSLYKRPEATARKSPGVLFTVRF
jgi:hypothetical protein